MARHRNVRGYNYDEDFEEDDLYGQSVEDDYCISPSTAAQFIYSRRDNTAPFAETEEYGYKDTECSNYSISSHRLTGVQKAQLDSCLDHMREVLGESVPEKEMVEAVLSSRFDVQQALDSVLAQINKQGMKIKSEESVIQGKATKDLFCSELFSEANLTNLLQETSDSASYCFDLSDPVGRLENPSNSSSDKTFLGPKKVHIPSVRKENLKCSCKSLGALPVRVSDILNDSSLSESVSKQATLPLVDRISTSERFCHTFDACFSSGVKFMEKNPSGKSSWDQTELKGVKDLKALLRSKEAVDASDDQSNVLVVLQKNSELDSKDRFVSPSGLISDLGNLMLDNKISHQFSKKTDSFENIPSFLGRKGDIQEYNSSPSRVGGSTFSVSESSSLADLLREHQESNSDKTYSLSDLCSESLGCLTTTDVQPSLQLTNQPHISSGMTELSGSLSSLTFSRASPKQELESVSLSDLIAKSTEFDSHHSSINPFKFHVAKTMPPAVVNSDIDLSVLIRKSTLSPENVKVQSDNLFPKPEVLFSKEGQQLIVAKGSKKRKVKFRSFFLGSGQRWTKMLSARPSAFAVTLCLHYPPKRRNKHQIVNLHKAFLYSRQIQEVKINEIGPLSEITPFDFKSPSPDDIVKAGQKRAFTR
uniref:Uncharacterized protein n=1 Tax=Sphaerodactylus townsendi TaxID=933632 RepID=A0ACB8GD20_9SAUR